MKFLVAQLTEILSEREVRQNLRGLISYLALLTATVVLFSVLFHLIMVHEGQQHSWMTGLYWTLTVMSTLGFGDITFQSDLGRLFSVVVLVTGIILLLIVLPFAFIRFFYAPWLEAQVRLRAPREVRDGTSDHVLICRYDEVARGLIERFEREGQSYYVIEPDPVEAAAMHGDGVRVMTGPIYARHTWEAARVDRARLVFVNMTDPQNTNLVLTIREVDADIPIAVTAEDIDSIDILELSGATHVIALKQALGQQLARRITVGTPQTHRVGRYEDVVMSEFPLYHTMLPGRTIRDCRLREVTGLNIVGVWERGRLIPAYPDHVLSEYSVPLVVGTEEQMMELDAIFAIYPPNENPVLVIGGGKVGIATSRALRERGIAVTILEKDPEYATMLESEADRVVIGDAASREVVRKAGLEGAPAVVLSTNDDATNIFLAIYCRKLAPETHIVSRITQEWNLEAIHRAGADFVLSYDSLAIGTVLSLVKGRELVIVGEGADLFVEEVPEKLVGRSLLESEIGALTGLNVIAIRSDGESRTNPTASTVLPEGGELVMLGTSEQHSRFKKTMG